MKIKLTTVVIILVIVWWLSRDAKAAPKEVHGDVSLGEGIVITSNPADDCGEGCYLSGGV